MSPEQCTPELQVNPQAAGQPLSLSCECPAGTSAAGRSISEPRGMKDICSTIRVRLQGCRGADAELDHQQGMLKQVQALQGGAPLSSGSLLQPLRNTIYDLIKLRRRLDIHADSQVWFPLPQSVFRGRQSRRAKQGMHAPVQASKDSRAHCKAPRRLRGSHISILLARHPWAWQMAVMPEQC